MSNNKIKTKIRRVEDLEVYRRLFKLAYLVHKLTLTLPKFETYELGSQARRSSNASAAILAEAFNNKHTNIYLEGIYRAQGELEETKHHLRMAYMKKYLTQKKLDYFIKEYEECCKMLNGLKKSLKAKRR